MRAWNWLILEDSEGAFVNWFYRSLIFATIIHSTVIFSLPVKAVLFDVFGTCVQVEESLIQQGHEWSGTHGVGVAWKPLIRAWIQDHAKSIVDIRSGKAPFRTVDQIHTDSLQRLFPEYVESDFQFDQKTMDQISQFWHRLQPWSDVKSGLERLRTQFKIATLSNANRELLLDLAKFGGLPWEIFFSAEQVKHYKPDDQVYESAERQLGLSPHDLMLVASHEYDLRAAKLRGWKTAFVLRPERKIKKTQLQGNPEVEFDFMVKNFGELADLMLTRQN